MTGHRIYLASSWRNEAQPNMVALLRAAGHEVYDFRNPAPGDHGFSWAAIDPAWTAWTADQQIAALEHPTARHGLGLDFGGMQWCSALVMLQPCGRSAALELGWAIGAGKRTAVLMCDGQEPELMVRLADMLTTSPKDLLAWLDRTSRGFA
jgi:nucleoside 2-deoxyribosyltransferase